MQRGVLFLFAAFMVADVLGFPQAAVKESIAQSNMASGSESDGAVSESVSDIKQCVRYYESMLERNKNEAKQKASKAKQCRNECYKEWMAAKYTDQPGSASEGGTGTGGDQQFRYNPGDYAKAVHMYLKCLKDNAFECDLGGAFQVP